MNGKRQIRFLFFGAFETVCRLESVDWLDRSIRSFVCSRRALALEVVHFILVL